MTVFRNSAEPSPMPDAAAQLEQQARDLAGKRDGEKVVAWTGPDRGLSQSLADLRKGYEDAAKVQSEASQQAALNRAMVDAKIDANAPRTSVQFIDHRPEQYTAGSADAIPSSDPAWTVPLDHLRSNLILTQELNQAVDKVGHTGSPKDLQRATEIGVRLERSMDRDFLREPLTPPEQSQQPSPQSATQQRPQTFENGEVYNLENLPDGNLEVQLITGERFVGDPITVTQKIVQATRPTPPPMLRSNNPESWHSANSDPHSMPLAELRKLAIQQELEGKEPSLNYR